MERKKRFILVGVLTLLLLGAIVFIILLRSIKKPSVPSIRPTATPYPTLQVGLTQVPTKAVISPTDEGKIDIVGVKVNDFRKSAQLVNPAGDVLIESNTEFQIVYLPAFTQFIITAYGPNYSASRQKAEQEFLKRLGISEDQACRLTVFVTFMDPTNPRSGDTGNYSLSFCEHEP